MRCRKDLGNLWGVHETSLGSRGVSVEGPETGRNAGSWFVGGMGPSWVMKVASREGASGPKKGPIYREFIAYAATGAPKKLGVYEIGAPFWGPYEKGILLFGSIFGVPYSRKKPGC